MTLEQRQKAHLEFMCAALNGFIVSPEHYSSIIDDESAASRACQLADKALIKYEERWEREEKELERRREASERFFRERHNY